MAKARLYSINPVALETRKKYVSGLKGQAKIVFDELMANREPRLAVEVEKACGSKLVTKQDTLRVVLYYIIVFKSKGLITALEPSDDDTPPNFFPSDEEIAEFNETKEAETEQA